MQPLLTKTSRAPFARKPHSIRLVEIQPTQNPGRGGIKLSIETSINVQPYCPALRISE